MIHIQYFGRLRDDLQCEHEDLDWQKGSSFDLLHLLRLRNSIWADALADNKIFKIAINHRLIHQHENIQAGDYIAFLPPITGG